MGSKRTPVRSPEEIRLRDSAGRKFCVLCDAWKMESEFYPSPRTVDGLLSQCKICNRARANAWGRANPAKVRLTQVRQKYGLTKDQYEELVARHGDACAICGQPNEANGFRNLAVDHCHTSGIVRGLLCSTCNLALGYLRDSPDLLRVAADYLERWQSSKP